VVSGHGLIRLGGLLGWGRGTEPSLHWHDVSDLDPLGMDVAEHDARLVPDFALVQPGEDVKPRTTELLGMVCPRILSESEDQGESWAATPAEPVSALCRHHEVELGLPRWTLLDLGVGAAAKLRLLRHSTQSPGLKG